MISFHIPVEQSLVPFLQLSPQMAKGLASLDPCYLWPVSQKLAKVSTLCTVSQNTPKLNLTDASMQQPQSHPGSSNPGTTVPLVL